VATDPGERAAGLWRNGPESRAGSPVDVQVAPPGCNGSTKAALRLAALGFQVKEMIGGVEWWERDGYDLVN
jgi:hypothetical protein